MFPNCSELLIIVAVMTVASSLQDHEKPTGCLENHERCDIWHSELCRTRYCHASRTCRTFGTTYDDSETRDFCADNPCPHGQICTYNTVTCIRAPCGPIMRCVDKNQTSCPTD